MRAFIELNAFERDGVAVLDVDKPGGHTVAQQFLNGLRHDGGRLACADDDDLLIAIEQVGLAACR